MNTQTETPYAERHQATDHILPSQQAIRVPVREWHPKVEDSLIGKIIATRTVSGLF